MLFHTTKFLAFFVIVFSVYWGLRHHRARMAWLLLASCAFYMSWNPLLITLILFSASVDYVVALQLEKVHALRWRRLLLILSIGANLGLLAFFKYVNFFLDTTFSALSLFGWESSKPSLFENVILPLGISFYTFETISYIVDVYQGRIKAVRNLLDYALYIMFFPHLVAGPIVRPRDFLPQIRQRKRFNWDRFQLGVQYFLVGLFKKAVIADHLARLVDPVFADPAAYGSSAVWLAVLAYAVQIYCDFSGYSDMAIGVAHTFGFKLPFNFNMPYLAANITDFWRRWHISLSSWLRDYLYVPLGGNRHGRWATYRNLLLTMLLGGLWHGANWTFVAWGLYHGALLALHRAIPLPRWLSSVFFRPVCIAFTFLSVCVGWVFFRAQTFTDAALILKRMFLPVLGQNLESPLVMVGLACFLAIVLGHLIGRFVNLKKVERWLPAPALGFGLACFLLLAQVMFPEDGKAFIYFQF
jgi:alginate O-acetyltransferase complex protein AlgI